MTDVPAEALTDLRDGTVRIHHAKCVAGGPHRPYGPHADVIARSPEPPKDDR